MFEILVTFFFQDLFCLLEAAFRIRIHFNPRLGSGSGSTSISFPGSGSGQMQWIRVDPGRTKTM